MLHDEQLDSSFMIASVLDPRYKSLRMLDIEQKELVYSNIQTIMENEHEEETRELAATQRNTVRNPADTAKA